MTLLGVQLHKPTFWGVTRATVFAALVLFLYQQTPWAATSSVRAGSVLAAALVGAMSNEIGIDISKGWRPMALNVICCVLVLLTWNVVASLL